MLLRGPRISSQHPQAGSRLQGPLLISVGTGHACDELHTFSLSVAKIRPGPFHIPLDALVTLRLCLFSPSILLPFVSPLSPATQNRMPLEPIAVVSNDNNLLMDVKLFNVDRDKEPL